LITAVSIFALGVAFVCGHGFGRGGQMASGEGRTSSRGLAPLEVLGSEAASFDELRDALRETRAIVDEQSFELDSAHLRLAALEEIIERVLARSAV